MKECLFPDIREALAVARRQPGTELVVPPARLKQLNLKVEQVAEALRPFAENAHGFYGRIGDEDEYVWGADDPAGGVAGIRGGDFRRAAEAYWAMRDPMGLLFTQDTGSARSGAQTDLARIERVLGRLDKSQEALLPFAKMLDGLYAPGEDTNPDYLIWSRPDNSGNEVGISTADIKRARLILEQGEEVK